MYHKNILSDSVFKVRIKYTTIGLIHHSRINIYNKKSILYTFFILIICVRTNILRTDVASCYYKNKHNTIDVINF